MRKLLLELHLYASLACAPYLVLYGVSTISFNHEWGGTPLDAAPTVTWEQELDLPPGPNRFELARAARDGLGLIGNLPAGAFGESTVDDLDFLVARPFRTYRIQWSRSTGVATVGEARTGFWSGLEGMHGLTRILDTNSGLLWGLYTWFSVVAMVFAVVTGVYVWWGRVKERRIGWVLWWISVAAFVFG